MTKEEREILKKHYFKLGKKGGRSTVEKYGKLKMQEWGKLGGWPKGRPRKPIVKPKNIVIKSLT